MKKSDILARLNEIILEEKGSAVTMDSRFLSANLDFMGTTFTLITMDTEYHFLGTDNPEDVYNSLNIKTLTVRDLVVKCLLSTAKDNI